MRGDGTPYKPLEGIVVKREYIFELWRYPHAPAFPALPVDRRRFPEDGWQKNDEKCADRRAVRYLPSERAFGLPSTYPYGKIVCRIGSGKADCGWRFLWTAWGEPGPNRV